MKIQIITVFAFAMMSTSAVADAVLYDYNGWTIRGSRTGPIAIAQAAINSALQECDLDQQITVDGLFGRGSRNAIRTLSDCPAIAAQLPADSKARDGAVTVALWSAIVADTLPPSVDDRAASLKLTFEATDYPKMQWNYCQNRPFFDPDNGQPTCFSNDRRSFITWGPNGATAGHGREVQAIINEFLGENNDNQRTVFDAAFNDEADAVLRMLTLDNRTDNGPLEIYLCSIWMDQTRRQQWRDGFAVFGARDDVQKIYKRVYRSTSFDGGKINAFYDVWSSDAFNLEVTEIDHGFFVDRSAHMSISKTKLRNALIELKDRDHENWPPDAATIRRHIALNVRPSNQRKDRLGRDIAFYIDGISEDTLNDEEVAAWRARGKRNAASIGLSDTRTMPAFTPGPAISNPMPNGTLTNEELALCPAAVLNPVAP